MTIDKKKDFLWILTTAVLILLWGSLPTWAGYQLETPELRFRGIYYDSQDYAAHISMMEAGRNGEWTYQFRFTTESFHPAYVRLFYIVLGHLSKWLGFSLEFTFHLARWLLGLLALFALYGLMQQIFPDRFWSRVAFLLAALGSGLGWLQLIFNITSGPITPIDFWLIDSYIFFSLSMFPHFAFVTGAMCLVLGLWLRYLENPSNMNIAWIALIAVIVQFINPIAFGTINASFVGAALFSWRQAKKSLGRSIGAISIIAIAQVPLLVYNLSVLSRDPLWSQYTRQHQTLSPPPDYYLWGFALFWPPAVLGTIHAFRAKSGHLGAAVFWIVTALVLAYSPLYTQQRFLQNITIPLAILATQGLIILIEQKTTNAHFQRWGKVFIGFFVFLTSLSSIQLSLGRSVYLQTYPRDFFYPARLDQAVEWLRQNAQYNDLVLASEETSQVLAQKTAVRLYSGHEMETLNYKAKQANVESFFAGKMPELASRPIKWVIYGPAERKLDPKFKIPSNLQLVYDAQELQIYQVK